ncbi:hypothetical protein NL676_034267 [Syzygium grande]|nr:hypothetical protein NL676_034267 [Syzygium grande]
MVLADVLRWLAGNSTKKLDVIAQYWQLNARPDDPRSGDYGYSRSDMLRFGADLGRVFTKPSKMPLIGMSPSGIVHAKVWISDNQDVYIGSMNNDWKSLSQLSFGKVQADEQAWVDTIKSVGSGATVRISTMDWLGQSQYADQTVYWSSISSAVSEDIVLQLQEVFDADWDSPYAVPVEESEEGHSFSS